MWRRLAVAVLLVAVVVLPTLAYASGPDPSWVAGFWDDGDYDDVILVVTALTAVPHHAPDVVIKPSPRVVGAIPSSLGAVRSASLPSSSTRAPPTA
jgi:hypothetical protein